MKLLMQAEYDELLAAKAERDKMLQDLNEAPVIFVVETMLAAVKRRGLVLTVEQEPLQPLAMGHYRTVFSLRQARTKA